MYKLQKQFYLYTVLELPNITPKGAISLLTKFFVYFLQSAQKEYITGRSCTYINLSVSLISEIQQLISLKFYVGRVHKAVKWFYFVSVILHIKFCQKWLSSMTYYKIYNINYIKVRRLHLSTICLYILCNMYVYCFLLLSCQCQTELTPTSPRLACSKCVLCSFTFLT
jgi:hypothetical protein